MSRTVKIKRRKKGVHEDGRLLSPAKSAKREENLRRQVQALELRSGGATYEQIALTLKCHDRAGAKRLVERALGNVIVEASKDIVRMDLTRLDEYIMRCTHDLRQNGNLGQIDRLMRIMEFRYRLLGISSEDVRTMQSEHGVNVNIGKGGVMVVQASPETDSEFIKKMMGAVGVDPNSPAAQKYLEELPAKHERQLPMLAGSANEGKTHDPETELPEEDLDRQFEDVVDAEIVE